MIVHSRAILVLIAAMAPGTLVWVSSAIEGTSFFYPSASGSGATIHPSQEAFPIIADRDAGKIKTDYADDSMSYTMEGGSPLFHKFHSVRSKIPIRELQDILATGTNSSSATLFTLQNHCNFTVWFGSSTTNKVPLGNGSFALSPNSSTQFHAPLGWTGKFWGRTGCEFDNSGSGKCITGDCGGNLTCSGGGEPPVTLVEFSLDGVSGQDFYDVSLVDGYNVGVGVEAVGGSGDCRSAGCVMDLNTDCPDELRIMDAGHVVACKSACTAFNSTHYFCCTGEHNSPENCSSSVYSKLFKNLCPTAYTYAYDDDANTTMSCSGSDYLITFCPMKSMFVAEVPAPSPTHSTVMPGPDIAPPIFPEKKKENPKRLILLGSIIGAFTLVLA